MSGRLYLVGMTTELTFRDDAEETRFVIYLVEDLLSEPSVIYEYEPGGGRSGAGEDEIAAALGQAVKGPDGVSEPHHARVIKSEFNWGASASAILWELTTAIGGAVALDIVRERVRGAIGGLSQVLKATEPDMTQDEARSLAKHRLVVGYDLEDSALALVGESELPASRRGWIFRFRDQAHAYSVTVERVGGAWFTSREWDELDD